MTSSISIVTQFEIARAVAKSIKNEEKDSQYLSSAVIKVIATFAKYVNHFSRKGTVLCDVPYLGQFLVEETFDFLPSQFFSNETGIAQSNRKVSSDGVLKKELTIEKIAQLCSVSNDLVVQILNNMVKIIVSKFLIMSFFFRVPTLSLDAKSLLTSSSTQANT